jgi:hypothetical protein
VVEARLRNSLHQLGPADYAAAERFLSRRHELDLPHRQRFGRQLTATILAKMPLVPAEDFPQPELLLEALVRLRRERPL